MTHPPLRLAAAKFALDLANISDLVGAAHAALDDAVYADGLAVIASTPDMQFWEAGTHFTAALRELGHGFASQDDALHYWLASFFGGIAEGVVSPLDGLTKYASEGPFADDTPAAKLKAYSNPSTYELRTAWWVHDDFEHTHGARWGHPDAVEVMKSWDADIVEECCHWCREYARLHLQPAWRSPAVVSLAAAIHADRAFDCLPILADALEEAGCDHPDLLGHCRHNSPHTDYCWLVDAVLNVR